jgi:hypothetical protein
MGLAPKLFLVLAAAVCLPAAAAASYDPPSNADDAPSKFAVGIGYPDLRERMNLLPGLDEELKAAFADGEQAYAGRLYLLPAQFGRARLSIGGEGGVVEFNGRDALDGYGFFAEPFVGLDYRFGPCMVNVDLGPAWIQLFAQGQTMQTWKWTYNTALYFFLF